MPKWINSFRSIKEFSARYPAVLSGYIIYSYLFIAMMRFFLKAKSGQLALYDIYETFDALPFMWLLASALVKIIDTRTKLHDSEKDRILSLRDLEIKQTQINTMQEVARGFQHKINNPLAIISLALSSMKRVGAGVAVILERMNLIEDSANRIRQAVIDFSAGKQYEVELVGHGVGSVASPPSSDSSPECIAQIDGLTTQGRKKAAIAESRVSGSSLSGPRTKQASLNDGGLFRRQFQEPCQGRNC